MQMKPIPLACAVFAIAIGIVVLVGWVLDLAVLKSVIPGFVAMKVNTAIGFVLAGGSLLLLAPESSPRDRHRIGWLLALGVALIGILTLGEEIFDWKLGIDQFLIRDTDVTEVFTTSPGRMAVTSMVAFSLLGLALLAIDMKSRRGMVPTEVLILMVMALSIIAAFEYVFGHGVVHPLIDKTRMAVHTLVTFFVLGAGVLAARPGRGIVGAIGTHMAGTMERRVYLALTFSLFALLVSGAATFFAAQDSAARSDSVEHTHDVRRRLAALLTTHQDVETGERGFVITGKPEFLQPFEDARAKADRVFQNLYAKVHDDPAQRYFLESIDDLRRQHIAWTTRVVDARRTHGSTAAEELIISGEGKRLMDLLRAEINRMDAADALILQERKLEESASVRRLNLTLMASTLLALAVLLFAGIVIHRDFSRRLLAERTIREQNDLLEQRVHERTAQLGESQARLEATVENLSEGVIVASLDGQLLHCNHAAMKMHGFASREDYLRKLPDFAEIFELTTTEGSIVPLGQWPLARILEGEALHELELGVRRLDTRSRRIFSYGGTLVREPGGQPIMALLTVRDITERVQAERRIHGQLEHLNLLDHITRATGERQDLDSIFQVVVRTLEESLPIDFGCVGLYDATANTLQFTSVGVKGAALAGDLDLDNRASVEVDRNGLSRCVQGHLVYEPDISRIQFPFPQRLSRVGLHSLVLAPLRAESKVFGVLAVARYEVGAFSSVECEFLRQLSEHVALAAHQAQLYESLQKAYDDLRQTQQAAMQEERLRALGQMASGIAHDINNALSPVSLYTESLLETEKNLSERARGYLGTIQRAVEDVANTVARMREFYRQRERQLELTPVDLNQLVRQVLELTSARWCDMAQQRGVVIEPLTELADELPKVMGVESEIREALTNLIFNAVDAMPDGGSLTLRTRLHGEPEQPGVAVEVVDSGIGMTDEARLRCLEPFFTTKGEQGTGLGLAMVFGMVQRHSAAIEIDSAPGTGTTMRLVFSASTPVVMDPGQTGSVLPEIPTHLRLLLIDDDPVLLKSLRDALETDHHNIVATSGGEAGIAMFRAGLENGEYFAAVITDLGMPYVDGRKVASAVKQLSPGTPVILLTGWGQRMIADGDVPPHVDRVLPKPPKLRDLREALRQLCVRATV